MKIVYVVRIGKKRTIWEYQHEAFEDWKDLISNNEKAWMYPWIMSEKRFESLPDFTGW